MSKKKFRQKYNKFVVEGIKIIKEVLHSDYKIDKIYTTDLIFDTEPDLMTQISEKDLKKISQLVQPNTALAVCSIPPEKEIQKGGMILALDDVRDPGNLGTIIRLADWFGIRQIVCSEETAELYNPKVLQASMGSFLRVQVNYTNLGEFLTNCEMPVLGTFMDGKSIYKSDFPKEAVLVMGNEANGITPKVEKQVTHRIGIPRIGQSPESLNVAMAAGIILGEFVSQNTKTIS